VQLGGPLRGDLPPAVVDGLFVHAPDAADLLAAEDARSK
jgi:hypothetical protein